MELLFTMVVPLTISGVALYGVGRQVDVYSALIHGAEEGLETLLRIVPALVGLLTAVSMLRASGALDLGGPAAVSPAGPGGRALGAAPPDAGAGPSAAPPPWGWGRS